MFRLVVSLACVLAVSAQNVDPKLAKILKEQRFNAGDGRAGAAFATEDGVVFREESDNAGNRIGQYSYVGDDGKTYVVRYSAGKDGFRILEGDHIPSGGQEAAAFVADPDAELEQPVAPVVEERRQVPLPPRQTKPRPQPVQVQPEPLPVRQIQPQPIQQAADPNRNPFINPHDPTHRNFRFNKNAVRFDPNNPLAKQQSLVPPCADCEGVNPFINPFDNTHQAGLLAGHLAGHLAGAQPRAQPRPRVVPQQTRPAPLPQPQRVVPVPSARPVILPEPTNRPVNIFPPGQLKLNRFETGFNFDFES